jgi:tricorn protease-like protein|tara:strand:- start:20820 stop:22013 length:1194 start_codon:yes stop_codon:yes gene_type:complete
MTADDLKKKYGYEPVGQQIKKIQASAQADDNFGLSVAASSSRIVVGAPFEDTTASNAGSAYIFDINGKQFRKIQANDAAANDYFGSAVAVSDTRIVVGAYGEDTTASDAGSAYIFDIYGNQLAKIQANDAEASDNFGTAVAVSDSRIVVGARYEDAGASQAGAAYIFDIHGNQLAKITASDAEASDNFGYAVACSDSRIVVGADGEDTGGILAGAAYIFDINGTELAKIQANDAAANDSFGFSVAASNSMIVAGAHRNSSNAGAAYIFDINGTQLAKIQAGDVGNSNFGFSVAVSNKWIVIGAPYTNAGSVYIFDINRNQITKLQASDAQTDDHFGRFVAVSDNRIVVGAPTSDDAGTIGSAYIFSSGFSPFGDLCAYYDLGDPTTLDTTFSWSDYK